ncbi:NADH:flavin oxidoreductase/NADH oxidase [Marinibaculum pumilum]|uniref:NADH:flavin oxidoreductase/NADH oxidase n=1 Tax=Marinibaculum pumilum TaxID=1766165 RepID=A0ABV7L439_9PROT
MSREACPSPARPVLLAPLSLRGLTLRNRLAISPMCQYMARDGVANDWHFAHLAKFALGGAGTVFVEATAVAEEGRITHGDVGLWDSSQVAPLRRIAAFLRAHGAAPAIQLGHAGRKAGTQRPWHGNGPLGDLDRARGEAPWPVVGPSPLAAAAGWPVPRALDRDDMARLREAWRSAALRALDAGFDVVELHCAHGYLLHQFLSPLSNRRGDAYGGDLAGRMRFPLEVAQAVRDAWPAERPMFVRISARDWEEDGWSLDDSVVFARALAARGIDLVDCSAGGLGGSATAARVPRWPGFQVPFAARVRRDAGIPTMAVGLITEPRQAEAVLAEGQADLVAIGREAMVDPNWLLRAERDLDPEAGFAAWPQPYGWWLDRRERLRREGA